MTVKITGSNVEITATDVKIKANVEVEGNLRAKGGTFSHEDVFVGDKHKHTKVVHGDDLSGPAPGG